MVDAKGQAQCYRELFGIPAGEPIVILKSPGLLSCPVAGERGVTNCPLGFEHRGVPSELEPWMRGQCEDDTWREKWGEILAQCQQCKGQPRTSDQQVEAWTRALNLLVEG